VILVYDVSNRDSFLSMPRWFDEAETNANEGAVLFLVGSKMDKVGARKVSFEEGEQLARERGAGFCEVSSKTREGVKKPFVEVVEGIVAKPELIALGRTGGKGTVQVKAQSESSMCGC
jgi:Ras-related protein Rab-18